MQKLRIGPGIGTFVLMIGLLFNVVPRAQAALYEVGPGKAYTSIGSVPWTRLLPGDEVAIYWRSEPYREKIFISCRGTAAKPIRVHGVPNASGDIPVIDGQNAKTNAQFVFPFAPTQDRGVVVLSRRRDQPWGTKPGYLTFEDLAVRNGYAENSFTDHAGASRTYTFNAASIFVERGEHIVVRRCEISGSGNGFFVASGDTEELISRDILVEHCAIFGCGNPGRDREHNSYTEALGVVFQYNYIGRQRPGGRGNALKDRSAGTVVRYNWIEGGAHALDLVEPQESYRITTKDPHFRDTWVYGNTFINFPGDGVNPIHYGGDNGDPTIYRKGTLHFYNNTMVIRRDRSEVWRIILFRLQTDDEKADVRNNVIVRGSATAGAVPSELSLLDLRGTGDFGINWVSRGWQAFRGGDNITGVVMGTNNFISPTDNDPRFADFSHGDLRPADNAFTLLGRGGALDDLAVSTHPLNAQYVPHRGVRGRLSSGLGSDLGAFEAGASRPGFVIRGKVMAGNTPVSGVLVNTATYSTATSTDGSYQLTGLAAGAYEVSASKSGYLFGASKSVVVGPSQSNVDFGCTAVAPDHLTLSATSAMGGAKVVGTVTLNGPAGDNGLEVKISSSDPAAQVPATVLVPSGIVSAKFDIATSPVAAAKSVVISVSANGVAKTGTLAIDAPKPDGITLNPSPVIGGAAVGGTVRLNGVAPRGGLVISLASDNSVATTPASVTVPEGATSAAFSVGTAVVTVRKTANITACCGVSKVTGALGIEPKTGGSATLSAVTMSVPAISGGREVKGTVTLGAAAPASGVVVTLASSNATLTSVPVSVSVAGGATSATFTVKTSAVASAASVTISATLGSVKKSASLQVRPAYVDSMSVSPSSVKGGASSTGKIVLSGPAPVGGFKVNLASSNTAIATAPASITIPAGASSITFTVPTRAVTARKIVDITGTPAGATRVSKASLTVNP